jgi:hypothetical protein
MNHVSSKKKSSDSLFAFPTAEEKTAAPLQAVTHDMNINQKLVTVTEDKMLLCLNRHLKNIGQRRWVQPLSLLATLLLALATSEFDKLRWVSADLLTATFIVSSFVTAGWLVWAIMHTSRLRELPQVVDDICEELRGQREDETPGERLTIRAEALGLPSFPA